jgi:glycosyltransferase involved in cell wall biosynthesis
VLDDASTDSSVATIRGVAEEHCRDIHLLANETNSGSLAKQWRKGLAECVGDYVWIAESDDVSDPAFLSETVRALEESGAQFCFTDSWQMDDGSRRTAAATSLTSTK